MSQPGQQTIAIHVLPNISRSKGNQIIKLFSVFQHLVPLIKLTLNTNQIP